MHLLFAYAAPIEAGPLPGEVDRPGVEFLELGVGKSACACTLTRRLGAAPRPDLVLLFGVCGAYRSVEVGDLCVVTEDSLADEGVATPDGFRDLADLGLAATTVFAMDARQSAAMAAQLADPPLPRVRGATVSTCSGDDAVAATLAARTDASVETMEGAAVALVCQRLGVPLVQLRCVSNRTGDRGAAGWDLEGACARLYGAVRELVRGSFAT